MPGKVFKEIGFIKKNLIKNEPYQEKILPFWPNLIKNTIKRTHLGLIKKEKLIK